MKLKSLILTKTTILLILSPLTLLAQSTSQLTAQNNPSNLDELPNIADQMNSWICSDQEDKILIEARDDSDWKLIIDPKSWKCQSGVSENSPGNLKFTCEPIAGGNLSLLSVTWLSGNDQNQQMGKWIHELANEHSMSCSLAKVELWDNDVTAP
ncbi:unknown [Crocosphaera subtropica ATCC 51142]|uniref:Uncharacterized protein n=1 Tax=Crocosphaera subtropica (strain ATCC 51142 / BH68) TaxID=43989 RepID=B1WVM1_CROS5|nr:hypothetical protein [Crocosphaera subtropica]ACB50608.1 unknown [Crocosphaera subtropica ATCC 51142]